MRGNGVKKKPPLISSRLALVFIFFYYKINVLRIQILVSWVLGIQSLYSIYHVSQLQNNPNTKRRYQVSHAQATWDFSQLNKSLNPPNNKGGHFILNYTHLHRDIFGPAADHEHICKMKYENTHTHLIRYIVFLCYQVKTSITLRLVWATM